MTSRILPVEEWPRLKGTEAEAVWPHCDPINTRVLVVEDEGRIVAEWMAIRMVHAECVWIDPTFRHSPRVIRRLLQGMYTVGREWGVKTLITAACTDLVRGLIQKLHGQRLPGESYALPLTSGDSTCPPL